MTHPITDSGADNTKDGTPIEGKQASCVQGSELPPASTSVSPATAQDSRNLTPRQPTRAVEKAAREGGAWSVITYAFSKVSGQASSIVLYHLLAREAFGLVGMSNTVLGIVQMVGNCGIGYALMHQRDDVDEYANTTWWLDVIFGAVMCTIANIAAPFAAGFYRSPQLEILIRVSSLNFLIMPIGGTMSLLLTRDLLFKLNAKIGLATGILTSLLTILFAALGAGVWSFIFPPIIGNIAQVIMRWVWCPWRPRLRVKWGLGWKLMRFGRNILGASLADYVNQNADYVLVGKLIGTVQLGVYFVAYNLGTWVVQNISITIMGVAFPTFASVQNEPERAKAMFLKLIRMIALAGFPIVSIEWAIAPLFVGVVCGQKWLDAVTAFRLIALYGIGRAVCAPGGTLISALGRPDINFKISAASCPVLVASIYLGSRYGINGVAAATAIAHGLFVWLYIVIPFRILKWNPLEALAAIAPAFVTSLIAALVAGTVYSWSGGVTNSVVLLLALISLGGCVYYAANRLLFPATTQDTIRILKTTLREAREG